LLLSQNVLIQAAPPPDKPTGLGAAESDLGKGFDALKQDRYEVAVEEFRAALAIDPPLVLRPQFPLAIAFFEPQKFAEARREFEAVTPPKPEITPTFCTSWDASTSTLGTSECHQNLNAAMTRGGLFAFEHLLSIFSQMLG